MADQKINITLAAIDKTRGAFGTITKSIGAVTSAVFSLKTAIVGVVGVGGIGLLVRNSLLATDALSKTADKLGVTTEALGAMRYAAELTGVATQTTDMAMQRFTRRLSEAAIGTGEAKGALQELNIDAQQLVQLPLDKQMLAVAGAFENVQNQSDRVRLAFKLFDSEGVALVNTLAQGEEALKGMFDEASSLGILMSSDAAQGVERANDALFRLSSLFGGIIDQIVAALAPAIEEFATSLKDSVVISVEEANGSIRKFAESLAKGLLNALAETLRAFARFIDGVGGFINIIIDAANAVQRFREQQEFARVNLSALTQGARDAANFIDGLSDSVGKYNISQKEANEGTVQSITLSDRMATAIQKAKDSVGTLQEAMDGIAKNTMKSMTDALYGLVTGSMTAAQAFRRMASQIIADMIRMAIQQFVLKKLFGFVGGLIGGPAGAAVGEKLAGSVGGKAIGGSVQAGKPYMVGERGAEMFIPNSSGSIVPNNQLGGSGQTVNRNVNVTFEVSTVDARGFDSLLQSRKGQIIGMINSAMNERGSRGLT